jgi:hypothetical protein
MKEITKLPSFADINENDLIIQYISNNRDKINEIIDRLNSQEQPEGKKEYKYPETYTGDFPTSTTFCEFCDSVRPDEETRKLVTDNLPEKANEDWKKGVMKFFDDMEDFNDNKTYMFVEDGYFDIDGLIQFISGLLKEREQLNHNELLTARIWGMYVRDEAGNFRKSEYKLLEKLLSLDEK